MIDNEPEIIRSPESIERVTRLMNSILQQMGYEASVAYSQAENTLKIMTNQEESGLLIGKQGQTLDAIQKIMNFVVNKNEDNYQPMLVDIDGYRERQIRSIEDVALKAVNKVIEEGVPVTLRPMTPYERRIVHITLKGRDDIETVSYGEEPGRRVTIYPTDAASEGTPLEETSYQMPQPIIEEVEDDEEDFFVEIIEEEDQDEDL